MAELISLNRSEGRAGLALSGTERKGPGLDRIAYQIRSAYERALAAEKQWIVATIQLARSLAAARDRFSSNQEFHDWLIKNCDFLTRNDRAALIGMGRNLELARTVLASTQSRTWRLIWDNEMRPQLDSRLHSAGKTTSAVDGKSYAIEAVVAESRMQPEFVRRVVENFRLQFRPGDTFHDGFRGTNSGGFFPALPPPRSWTEIQLGR